MIYKFLKQMVIRTTILCLFLTFSLNPSVLAADFNPAWSTVDDDPVEGKISTIFDLLNQEENELDVTIEFDMSALMESRRSEEQQKATFSYKDANKETQEFELKVELRGKFRRRVCQFPPIMLKFSKKELKARGLQDHNDLKLVTHCIDDKSVGNDNVIREYLLYKMFNELTDRSYRVKLIKITYKDSEDNYPKIKRWAFLIEDTDEMAERLGGLECEQCLNVPNDSLDARNENLVSFYQFMIGNSDWSSFMDRNVKFVNRPGDKKKLIVPYDFDFSGMVNASYAIPSSDYGLTSVKDRVFLGRDVAHEVMVENIRLLLDKKETLYDIVTQARRLSYEAQDEMLDYMDTFYELIETLDYSQPILPQLRGPQEKEAEDTSEYIINRNQSG